MKQLLKKFQKNILTGSLKVYSLIPIMFFVVSVGSLNFVNTSEYEESRNPEHFSRVSAGTVSAKDMPEYITDEYSNETRNTRNRTNVQSSDSSSKRIHFDEYVYENFPSDFPIDLPSIFSNYPEPVCKPTSLEHAEKLFYMQEYLCVLLARKFDFDNLEFLGSSILGPNGLTFFITAQEETNIDCEAISNFIFENISGVEIDAVFQIEGDTVTIQSYTNF